MMTTARRKNTYVRRHSDLLGVLFLASVLVASTAAADELHPLMDSKYWAKAGAFFAARDLKVSAIGSFGADPGPGLTAVDFDSATGLDDRSDIFTIEFGWQFGEKWDFALQYFRSSRSARGELSREIEWEDVVYEAGVVVDSHSSMSISRLFFSRRVWDKGPHDFRLGAGVHWLETGVSISGEARLEDMSSAFQSSVVSAKFPFPNIGAWYRYSPSDRWVFQTRVDWLSATTDDYGGGIWNIAAGVDYALTKNIGIGFGYQFFELDGTINEDTWRGDIATRFEGLTLSLDAFW